MSLTRRSFLRSLGLLAAAPYLAAHVRFVTLKPAPNLGDPVPILQTGLFRMADGSLVRLCPDGPSLYILQTADGRYHGGRATWDPMAGAFRPDKPLPADRLRIEMDDRRAPQAQQTNLDLLPS